MKNEKISVSLIIPTFNRVSKLFRLMKSLDKLNPYPEEIIIIDDNSTDGTKNLLTKWKAVKGNSKKRIILKDTNKGPAHSRNLGIFNSGNDLVAFTPHELEVGYELDGTEGEPSRLDLAVIYAEIFQLGIKSIIKEIADGTAVDETSLNAASAAKEIEPNVYWPKKGM